MQIDWISAVTGLVGAIIGGLCTLIGVQRQLHASTTEQKRREDIHRKAILQALHDELETLSEVYKSSAGGQIAVHQAGAPLLLYWPVSFDYFSVYHGNAALIGHLKDNDLRKSIIQTYTYAKATVDSFKLNNIFVEKYQQSVFITSQAPTDANKQVMQANHHQLVQYAIVLHESHKRLERSLEDTLRRLRKAGVLSEQN